LLLLLKLLDVGIELVDVLRLLPVEGVLADLPEDALLVEAVVAWEDEEVFCEEALKAFLALLDSFELEMPASEGLGLLLERLGAFGEALDLLLHGTDLVVVALQAVADLILESVDAHRLAEEGDEVLDLKKRGLARKREHLGEGRLGPLEEEDGNLQPVLLSQVLPLGLLSEVLGKV